MERDKSVLWKTNQGANLLKTVSRGTQFGDVTAPQQPHSDQAAWVVEGSYVELHAWAPLQADHPGLSPEQG